MRSNQDRRKLASEWRQLREAVRFSPRSARYVRMVLRAELRIKRREWAATHPRFAGKQQEAA